MKYLKIQNDGLLDIRLVALMGGTTKSGDKYKIGQFGTGLKYTLAYLFRNNIDFKFFSGETLIDIDTEQEQIKETNFEIIRIGGHRTSITTQMGHQWTAWMIIRELWCNALDEGGGIRSVVSTEDDIKGEADKSTFFIQLTPDIQDVLDNWDSYFIHQQAPLWENEEYAIYENNNSGKLKLYKQGVLIYQHQKEKSLFYYDIKGAEINELREFKGSVHFEIFNALRNPGENVVSHFLNNITESHFEGCELDYGWYTSFAKIWKDTIGDRRITHVGKSSGHYDDGVEVNFNNVIQLPKNVYKALVKDFEGIGVLTMSDEEVEFYEIPSAQIKSRVDVCLSLLSASGYNIKEGVRIKYGAFTDNNVFAAANRKKNIVMVSEACLKISDDQLMVRLIENNEYLKVRVKKYSAEFGRHLISLFVEKSVPSVFIASGDNINGQDIVMVDKA